MFFGIFFCKKIESVRIKGFLFVNLNPFKNTGFNKKIYEYYFN